jgi:RNA polymerase sigma-70 factor (ECF subfamily)
VNIATILKQINQGNKQAYAEIVEHYQHSLFAYLGRMGISQGMAEELAQETFLRAWQNLERFDPNKAAFSTWLFTIARRLALNELSRFAYKYESSGGEYIESTMDDNQTPGEDLTQQQQKQILTQALLKLPLDQRNLLALAYVQELELADIARIEDCPVGTIKSRLYRARQTLIAHLPDDTLELNDATR